MKYVNQLWIFFILFFCFQQTAVQGEELHAIIVADTLAVNIGPAVEKDLQKVVSEISRISSNANLPFTQYLFKGKDITSKGILNTIRSLPVESNDVILFYFSGHGYRTKSKNSPWPNLFVTKENAGIDFDLIHKEIEKKCPRLIIIFADVCNNIVPDIFAPPLKSKAFIRPGEAHSRERVQEFKDWLDR